MTTQPRPHSVRFPASDVQRLRQRLAETRWAPGFDSPAWSYGPPQEYVRTLVDYWRTEFDFDAAERRINAVPNWLLEIDGLDIHFLHARAATESATPILVLHGWPGSVVEFLEAAPRLADPSRYGAPADEAFHVVAPSLQGYAYSPSAPGPGMSPRAMAIRFAVLMEALGYDRYLVQGGDWGSLVASHLAAMYPERVIGLHLSIAQPFPPNDVPDPMTLVEPHELPWVEANARHQAEGLGYYAIQATRPEALEYALTDSPAGWCAWVLDKFHAWTDAERDGIRDLRNALSWDTFLTNLSLYWFTGSIGSSIRLYREQSLATARGEGAAGKIEVPTGVTIYPAEIVKSPRAWMERRVHLVRWTTADSGGHFAAMEQPAVFADDLRAFHRALRSGC
ncbi:epoxide hydrolase family protein [Nocardia sp. NPDC004278]